MKAIEVSSEESETEDSESGQSSSESDEEDDVDNENSSPEESVASTEPVRRGRKKLVLPAKEQKRSNKMEDQCLIEGERYFQSYSTKGSLTSNHTLDRLKTSELNPDKLDELLRSRQCKDPHRVLIALKCKEYRGHFEKWLMVLNEDFNLLLYGLGSKRELMNRFQSELLKTHPTIIINGFFPGLTIQDVLTAIATDLLEIQNPSANGHEVVERIEQELMQQRDLHIFLVVHNIDGPNLRSPKVQDLLSRLARMRNIHLIASVDHINAPLLWDHTRLGNFNFMWFDVTTMEPYTAETKFETSVISKNSGNLVLSSMRSVFASLTSNSKAIYELVIKHQLEGKGNANYQGMSFKELYAGSRDSFLVSSDIALRAQLTEFTDHKLVRLKRGADGMELLSVPIPNHLLEQFMAEITSSA